MSSRGPRDIPPSMKPIDPDKMDEAEEEEEDEEDDEEEEDPNPICIVCYKLIGKQRFVDLPKLISDYGGFRTYHVKCHKSCFDFRVGTRFLKDFIAHDIVDIPDVLWGFFESEAPSKEVKSVYREGRRT